MGRVMMLTAIALGIVLAYQLIIDPNFGLQGIQTLLSLSTGEFNASAFFDALFSITGLFALGVLAGGMVASLFARGRLENFIVLPFITGTLVAFVGVFIRMIMLTRNFATEWAWIGYVMTFVMTIFALIYTISLVEFFRGNV